jgi:uncharacterized protein (TIGR02271 family)
MAVDLGRATAAALVAALTDSNPQQRRGLSAGRALATGAVLGTLGRVAARRAANLVKQRVRDARIERDADAAALEVDPLAAGDDAMTRSEEELEVRTARRQRARVRLRKYIVTEDVQRTIPVRREEIRVEEAPNPEHGARAGIEVAELSGDDEIVLHEEVPVIEKRVVPRERVRVVKDSHTDEAQIVEELRKERIDLETDDR